MDGAERFQRFECIGRGSFGDVYRGFDKVLSREVAIKVIELDDVEDDLEDIHKEVAVLAGCQSPYITQYYASVLVPGTSQLLIIMELLAASVADLLDEGPMDEKVIAHILRDVLQALCYLHGEQRIHRDLKAANILLSLHGDVKISDFGVAGQLTGTLGFRRRTFVGTPYWMAPEVIESSEEGYTKTADIWSVGITAIELATGSPPNADLHPMRVLFLIPKSPPPTLDGPFSRSFKDFVATCLQKESQDRPSASQLLKHEFLQTLAPKADVARIVQSCVQRRKAMRERLGTAILPSHVSPRWESGGTARRVQGTVRSQNVDLPDATIRGSLQGTVKKNKGVGTLRQNGTSTKSGSPHAVPNVERYRTYGGTSQARSTEDAQAEASFSRDGFDADGLQLHSKAIFPRVFVCYGMIQVPCACCCTLALQAGNIIVGVY
eukprot:jgi/Botrbrau1/17808/Bobra.0127s0055.2